MVWCDELWFLLFHVCLLFSCGEVGISMHSGKKANGLCAALENVQLRNLGTVGTYHPLTYCTYALSWKWCFQMVVGSFNKSDPTNKLQRFFRNGGSWEFVDYRMSFDTYMWNIKHRDVTVVVEWQCIYPCTCNLFAYNFKVYRNLCFIALISTI